MTLDEHKAAIMAALRDGRARGKKIKWHDNIPALSDEDAWYAIKQAIYNTKQRWGKPKAKRVRNKSTVSKKGGRPHGTHGSPSDHLVGFLAPIYERYTGAKATVSHDRKAHGRTIGPFPRFICAVAPACSLQRMTSNRVEKAIIRLQKWEARAPEELVPVDEDEWGERNPELVHDERDEIQARFQSSYRTTAEIFGPALAKLLKESK